jgi:predicted RNase H-like HicB family nuclease
MVNRLHLHLSNREPNLMKFKVALYHSDEGYSVSVSSLPGCWSQGTTIDEALANISDAIREYLAAEIPADDAEILEIEVPV